MKHVELDIYFVRERVLDKKLLVNHIFTLKQPANLRAKPLHMESFIPLRRKLSVMIMLFNLRRGVKNHADQSLPTDQVHYMQLSS